MDYQKHYDALIQRAQSQNRKRLKKTDPEYIYYEQHHIIPDCLFINRKRNGPPGYILGDPDAKTNLIFLTPEEHYTAHLLLVKIYPNNYGLVRAATMMSVGRSGQRSNNKSYGWLKRLDADAKSKSQTGVKTGPNPKKSIKGRKLCTKGTKRGPSWNAGKTKETDDTVKKMAESMKGVKTGPNLKKGRPGRISEKKGEKIGPRQRLVCPHCNLEGSTPGISLYHFDNCKDNPDNDGLNIRHIKRRIYVEVTCPHCGKIGKSGSMKQWHFDRCKQKPI